MTDESTSVERQREIIQNWADANGHEVVAWAEDVDVSGTVSPFDTPGLGPYLQKPLQDDWDILCAWKLDRLARSSITLHQLFGWVQDHNKTLICVSDNIDLSTWVGRLVASVIAGVAEGELEAIRERVRASRKTLRNSGRWFGGRVLFGYQPVEIESGGWRLDLDPEQQKVLGQMVEKAISGESCGSIATWLNQEEIPTQHDGSEWSGDTVRQILRSKGLLGWTTHGDRVIFDDSGRPVLKGPPSLTQETWDQLQQALDKRSFKKTNKDSTSPLLGVLECWHCEAPMYVRRTRTKAGTVHTSYHCSKSCKQISINGDVLLPMVYDQFEQELADFPILKKKIRYAANNEAELAEAEAAYQELASYLGDSKGSGARAVLFKQLDILESRIQELSQAPEHDQVSWEETGQTYGEEWDRLDQEGKRQLMIRTGIKVRAQALTKGTRHAPGVIQLELLVPQGLKERLHK